ncbi:MAG: hypothetical protein CSB46_08405 [Micrococcales bacterium]|nr:MAG: hypothetical protein CSB46_08405 [Micrococcales bacterium]
MSNHPDLGTLRAYLDHEAPDHDQLTAHVRACLECTREIRTLRADAMTVTAHLDVLAGLRSTSDGGSPRGVVGIGMLSTPAGRAVAADLLSAFHSEQVAAVRLTADQAAELEEALYGLGEPKPDEPVDNSMKPVASVEEAAAMVPLDIAQPEASVLPEGVDAVADEVLVSKSFTVGFEFDEEKTKSYMQDLGSQVQIPDGYDGTTLTVTYPDAVALVYLADDDTSDAEVIVGTAGAVSVNSDGLSLPQLQSFLEQVPGIPDDLMKQLNDINVLEGTLPIPIPTDYITGENTEVGGNPAVKFAQPGVGSGYLWQESDRIIGVAAVGDEYEAEKIAESLAD